MSEKKDYTLTITPDISNNGSGVRYLSAILYYDGVKVYGVIAKPREEEKLLKWAEGAITTHQLLLRRRERGIRV